MRFGSFFMAEYINMIVIAGIAAAMFFGGWMGPGPSGLDPLWMVLKMLAVIVSSSSGSGPRCPACATTS